MFKQKQKLLSLGAVAKGRILPLSEVPDEVFSTEMLGKGYAIDPKDEFFYVPLDGRIETVAEAKHAYTLLGRNGIELLIHIGVDTVELNGSCFFPAVKAGQSVARGDPLCRVELERIRGAKLSPITSVIITNDHAVCDMDLYPGIAEGPREDALVYRIK